MTKHNRNEKQAAFQTGKENGPQLQLVVQGIKGVAAALAVDMTRELQSNVSP